MKQSLCNLIFKHAFMCIFCCIMISIRLFAAPSPEGIQVYQKNMHLSEEHKQKLAADIYRYYNAENMWDEIRHEFSLPHYEDNPRVQEQINWFMSHQDFLLNSANRAAPYLYFIAKQVRKRHLPAEIVLLPMMESAYNPFAYSTVGAAGIWQMMPGTASGFGIKQDWWYDGRRDVVASTRAALDYLAYLGSFFDGNWLLAIAAYDTGEGNVLSAIRKNIRDGQNTDYWSLPVAQETKIYIPRLLALATIISHPEQYPIPWPDVRNAPYLAQVDIGGQIDLNHAAELAGLSLKKIKQLNSGHNRSTTDPHGPFKLVLPIERVQQFTENLARSPLYEEVKWIRYKIKPGDKIVNIAKRFNIQPSQIRKANPSLAYNLKPGKQLIIPKAHRDISKDILETNQTFFTNDENPKPRVKEQRKYTFKNNNPVKTALENFRGAYHIKSGDTLYMVRKGDDLQKIANRFHLPVKTLLAVNQFNTKKHVIPGEKLVIPTHMTKNISPQKKYQLSSGDTLYMVRKGDTIEKIARKFHMSPSNLRLANLLTSNSVKEGDSLIIPTHLRVG